jgi:Cu2+-exporting ATPase
VYRNNFFVALGLTVAGLVIGFLSADAWAQFAVPALYASAVVIAGRVFFIRAVREIRDGLIASHALVSLAIILLLSTAIDSGFGAWWQASATVTIALLVNWLAGRQIHQVTQVRGQLRKLLPTEALKLVGEGEDQHEENVLVVNLQPGDVIVVKPGQRIAVDGVVVEGSNDVDESVVDGVAKFIYKDVADQVVAGSLTKGDLPVGQGTLTVRVTGIGAQTKLGIHLEILDRVESQISPGQVGASHIAKFVALGLLILAGIAAVLWGLAPEFSLSQVLALAAAVLLIFAPESLAQIIPLSIAAAVQKANREGVLVHDRAAFALLAKADVLAFEKTGTLTTAERTFEGAYLAVGSSLTSVDQLLALAAGLEAHAKHSVASRIVLEASMRKLDLPEVLDFRAIPGQGVTGIIEGDNLSIGSAALLTARNIDIHVSDLVRADAANQKGNTVVFVLRNSEILGYFELGDALRPSAKSAVYQLHANRNRVALLTGDAKGVADWIASQLGIVEVYSELSPLQRPATIQKLKADGSIVAVVGDAQNDAAALAEAQIAIAVGDETVSNFGLQLLSLDPLAIAQTVRLAQKTSRRIFWSFAWAVATGLISITLLGVFSAFAFSVALAVIAAALGLLPSLLVATRAKGLGR